MKKIGNALVLVVLIGLSVIMFCVSCDQNELKVEDDVVVTEVEDNTPLEGYVTFGANYHVINCITTVTVFLDGENIGILQNPVDSISDCGEAGILTKKISAGEHSYKVEIRPQAGEGCMKDLTGTFTVSENECKKIFIDYSLVFSSSITFDKEIDDDKILALAYDRNYVYPDGFFYEKDLIASRYYENTVSVKKEHIWIYLHTTDINEARNWSNLSNDNSSVNRILIQENENEKYFEFVRVNVENENDILLSRVHRSDYFIPHTESYTLPFFAKNFTGIITIGTYKGNVSLSNVKEFIEYLWDCGTIYMMDGKVVKSTISEEENNYEYYIQSIRLVYGDWGIYDTIYVYNSKFILDKETKVLSLVERKLIKEIKGKLNSLFG